MKPAAFDYVAPRELTHVLELLSEYGDDAKVLAGGQTLGPLLNLRVASPAVVIDINHVQALAGVDRDHGLTIGALTRQSELEDAHHVATIAPLIAEAIPFIAHRPIRNRGTVGGSLAHADPAAEWGGLVLAMDAQLLVARAGGGFRRVASTSFFNGMLETALASDELLVAVHIPDACAGTGTSFLEVARRHGDFALAGVCCRLVVDAQSRVQVARLALIGLGDRPFRSSAAEEMLINEVATPPLIEAVAELVAQEIDPLSDLHATANYRRRLARVLIGDALVQALARAKANLSEQVTTDGRDSRPDGADARFMAPSQLQAEPAPRAHARTNVTMTVNGREVTRSVSCRTTLADFLRYELGLTGTHLGCEHGVCGACTVHFNARAVRSCILYAVQAEGAVIATVEGLAEGERLHPLQQAFGERGALQCGFCTPGFLMSALDLLQRCRTPNEGQVRAALAGNLCRCTGYQPIVEAVLDVAEDASSLRETVQAL